jgi:hypothetical protein
MPNALPPLRWKAAISSEVMICIMRLGIRPGIWLMASISAMKMLRRVEVKEMEISKVAANHDWLC